jgi:hypothetical protein
VHAPRRLGEMYFDSGPHAARDGKSSESRSFPLASQFPLPGSRPNAARSQSSLSEFLPVEHWFSSIQTTARPSMHGGGHWAKLQPVSGPEVPQTITEMGRMSRMRQDPRPSPRGGGYPALTSVGWRVHAALSTLIQAVQAEPEI